MKKLLFFILLFGLFSVSCQEQIQDANYDIVPLLNSVVLTEGERPFILDKSVGIISTSKSPEAERNIKYLRGYISDMTGFAISQGEKNRNIKLNISNEISNPEGYRIKITEDEILIESSTEAGIFYGIQTLRKTIPVAKHILSVLFVSGTIEAEPIFSYRGMMLDVARHFMPVEDVKTFIDILALHNMNTFHWHLTEDQGWRVEIKKYPKLTEVGSQRSETVIGRNSGNFDGKPHGGFYTQEQIKEVVKYAQDRHITIIPEIDLPGHMLAALAAYPELGCTGGPYEVGTQWGVYDDVLCLGKDGTYEFIENVLNEVMDLFPSEYIHIGGDECPKTRWEKCESCKAKIKKLKLRNTKNHSAEEYLQSHGISFAEEVLNKNGRNLIGWDEILEGGLAPNATVMSWRGVAGGIEAAKQGHDVIMTPNSHFYFDHYQTSEVNKEPLAIGGYLPLEKVYSFDPIPDGLNPEQAKHIIGVQANVWTEYMPNLDQVEYMILPRIAALSEVQWVEPDRKNYECFVARMVDLLEIYELYEYNYADHLFDVRADIKSDLEEELIRVTLSAVDSIPIYYTLDASEPNSTNSILYTEPLEIEETAIIRAASFRENRRSNVFTQKINFNKATCKKITNYQAIVPEYEFGGKYALIDGLKANNTNYRSGKWIGFNKKNLRVIIDMKDTLAISNVEFNICVVKGDWVFDTRGIEIQVSQKGRIFTTVFKESYPSMKPSDADGIKTYSIDFEERDARYVRITALTERSIPGWHSGRGEEAYLFVDEISIK